jgi:hypothetical protein
MNFIERVQRLEQRFDSQPISCNDISTSCDESLKKIVGLIRKENQGLLDTSELQKEHIRLLENKLKEQLHAVNEENGRYQARISDLIDSRFRKFSDVINSRQRTLAHAEQVPVEIPQALRATWDAHENECAVRECRIQTSLCLTFRGVHAALLRERVRREEDAERFAAEIEELVRTLVVL